MTAIIKEYSSPFITLSINDYTFKSVKVKKFVLILKKNSFAFSMHLLKSSQYAKKKASELSAKAMNILALALPPSLLKSLESC